MSSRIEIASGIRHLLFWRAAAEAEIQSLIATPIPQLHAARSTVPNLQIHSPSFSGSGRAARGPMQTPESASSLLLPLMPYTALRLLLRTCRNRAGPDAKRES